ncbi:MAG: response regulator [Chloroflexi bacterium]|nr:response regulator [Chloroflexota bacterium]
MTKTVMIADDEEGILTLIQQVLETDNRLRVVVARDGEEALRVARREKPDLIFLDVRMPKMVGYNVCAALKEDPAVAHVKVVILTALTQEADRQRAFNAGADDYMSKPFNIMDLLARVERFLALEPKVGASSA